MHQFTLAEIVILVAVTIGAITDIKTKKIYNVITFPTAALGIIINAYDGYTKGGLSGAGMGALMAVLGWILGVGLTVLPNLRKGPDLLHMGDAKMWGAIGACLLPGLMLICWFYFSLVFGCISIFLIAKSIPRDQIKGFWLMVKTFFTAGVDLSSTVDTTEVEAARKALIPICPAIAIGTLLGILFEQPLLQFLGLH